MKLMIIFTACLLLSNRLYSDTVLPCIQKASKLLEKNDFTAVLAIEDCPESPVSNRIRGMAYSNLYNADSALYYLKKAYSSDITDDTLLIHLGRALLWKKEIHEAGKVIDKIQKKTTVDAMLVEALRHKMNNNFKAAHTLYKNILTISPDNLEVIFEEAQLLAWEKKFQESAVFLDKLTSAQKTPLKLKSRSMCLKAQVLSWNKDFGAAHMILQTVIKQDSLNTEARLIEGEIFEWEGKYREAKEIYKDILLIDNGNSVSKLRLEKLLWVK